MEKREALCCWVSPATELIAEAEHVGTWEMVGKERGVTARLSWPLECVLLKVYQLIDRHFVI